MFPIIVLTFAAGMIVGRAGDRSVGRRRVRAPKPSAQDAGQGVGKVVKFDLPRWGQQICANTAGDLSIVSAFGLDGGLTINEIHARYMQIRHDLDDYAVALHDFGVRTGGGRDYLILSGRLGALYRRIGDELSNAVLNSPEIVKAADQIGRAADALKAAVQRTKLPTSGVGDFTSVLDLGEAAAGLFKR